MSTRPTHRQKYPSRGKKGNRKYKWHLTKELILRQRERAMTDWDEEVNRAAERAMEAATAVIRKDGPKSKPFCVYSEKTGRKFGCYPTRKQAEERLAQIEKFKHIKGDESK